MNEEKNYWLIPREERLAQIRQERETSEYKKREANERVLAGVLTRMLVPLIPKRPPPDPDVLHRAESTISSSENPNIPLQKDIKSIADLANDMYANDFYADELSVEDKIFGALRLYAAIKNFKSVNTSNKLIIQMLIDAAKKLHRLGASLYLFQQIYDRKLCKDPGIGKAQWLVANAPLTEGEKLVPRGDPTKITALWKQYYSVSDWWAALVVVTKSPLEYTPTLLLDFLRSDPDDVDLLMRKFNDFRRRVIISRTNSQKSNVPHLRRGLDVIPGNASSCQDNSLSDREIPDLLAAYQWDALDQYRSDRDTVARIRQKKAAQ